MLRRYLRIAAVGLGALVYVWLAAVGRAPEVRARKAARREREAGPGARA